MVSRDLVHRFLKALDLEQGKAAGTIQNYRRAYGYFWTYLQSQNIKAEKARITRHHIQSWVVHMRTRGNSPSTIRGRISALSAMFHWMVREGLLRGNPVSAITRPPAQPWKPRGAVPPTQMDRIWAVAASGKRRGDPQARVALLLMWQAGARLNEVRMAEWEFIDLTKRAWDIQHGKGGRTRWVPLPAQAMRHLLILWENRGRPRSGPVFVTRQGTRTSNRALYRKIKRICREAEVPHVSPHWFRHTFATRLGEIVIGDSPAALQKMKRILGHRSITTTEKYLHVEEQDRSIVDLAFGPEDFEKDDLLTPP